MPENNTQQETTAVLRELARQAAWVALTVRRPRMNYQIQEAIVSIPDHDSSVKIAEDLVQQPRWKLLPEETANKFNRLEQRARKAVSQRALSFTALRGVSLLPLSKTRAAFEEIRSIDAEFQTERAIFTENYDGKKRWNVTNLATDRKTTFRSAAKFRYKSEPEPKIEQERQRREEVAQ